MKLENITGYNGWKIHTTKVLISEEKERVNVFATFELDGVERCIGLNSSKGVLTLDESNPSGYKNGIRDMEELLNLIDEKGSQLIQEIREEIEYKKLVEIESSSRYFETHGRKRFEELTSKLVGRWRTGE